MTSPELLELFDRQERIQAHFPGVERQTFPELVRYVRPGPGTNYVLYSRLQPETADPTIGTQINEMQAFGGPISWKVYSHDLPADLADRLERHGFVSDTPAPTLILDLSTDSTSLVSSGGADIRRLSDSSQLIDVVAVEEQVWHEDFAWVIDRFSLEMEQPGFIEIFVAYVDETPASTGWIHFQPGSQFASLWGGSTLEAHRGKGLYTAILAERVHAARLRGRRYVTVEAEPASQRILLHHGFEELSMTRTFTWSL